jgi:RHS repeat-associated protein
VDFFRGTTRIGTDTNAPYSVVLNNVPFGTYVFTALAVDSGGSIAVSNPVIVRVDNPPSVALTAPAENSAFLPGADIPIAASASDSDEVVRKVEFFAGGTLIGTKALAPYQITWRGVAPGHYSLTARATDLVGLVTTSAPVVIAVGSAPTVAIVAPNPGAVVKGGTITVTALASDSDGAVAKVEFFDGGSLVGTATTSSGNSTYSTTLSNLALGSHTLIARATDDQGFSTSSIAVPVIVTSAVAQIYYIHTDHLNTPRMIANQAGTAAWRWDQSESFGDSVPNVDPGSDGIAFDFPLRFPGQYFDKETNLAYNYFRDYNSGTGMYIEPEPLGLRGDINLYRYARNNVLGVIDSDGQAPVIQIPGSSGSVGISASIPVFGPISLGGGTGLTLRRCCSASGGVKCCSAGGQVFNELLWTARFGVGAGISVQPTASGRGTISLIQIGGLPLCSPSVSDTFLGSIDVAVGPFSGRYNGGSGIISGGLSPGGTGASIIINMFERTVAIAQTPTGECCSPKR